MAEPICVISGVGPGTGTALVRRFASEGYRVAMLARTPERLAGVAAQVPLAKAFLITPISPLKNELLRSIGREQALFARRCGRDDRRFCRDRNGD
jgi:NAD(P)-dependent dehydrogenase (short-subunit alcohol dehydrogenase family)